MVRDGVANMVSRLQERGFDPRRVGHDAWESRCPGHRSLDHALCITRNEHNHVVLECRGAEKCQHTTIIRALGFTNDLLYTETTDWLISQLRRVAVEPSSFARRDEGNANARIPVPAENRDQPDAKVRSWDGGPPGEQRRLIAAQQELRPPEILHGAALSGGGATSQSIALAVDSTAAETVQESPTDALMRMAGVDRVILGSDGRSYALVSVNGQAECRELKSKALAQSADTRRAQGDRQAPHARGHRSRRGRARSECGIRWTRADVFLRVARGPSGSSYFLDLADHEGRIIEIRPDGWEQVQEPASLYPPRRSGSLHCLCRHGAARSSS